MDDTTPTPPAAPAPEAAPAAPAPAPACALTIKDVCARFGVTPSTVARWRRGGILPDQRRWSEADIAAVPGKLRPVRGRPGSAPSARRARHVERGRGPEPDPCGPDDPRHLNLPAPAKKKPEPGAAAERAQLEAASPNPWAWFDGHSGADSSEVTS